MIAFNVQRAERAHRQYWCCGIFTVPQYSTVCSAVPCLHTVVYVTVSLYPLYYMWYPVRYTRIFGYCPILPVALFIKTFNLYLSES